MRKISGRMCSGGAREEDPDLLLSVANQIEGRTICAFGEAAAWPTQSFVGKFKDEFLAKANQPAPDDEGEGPSRLRLI